LAQKVYLSNLTLQHIPKTISLSGSQDTAPKDFVIYVSRPPGGSKAGLRGNLRRMAQQAATQLPSAQLPQAQHDGWAGGEVGLVGSIWGRVRAQPSRRVRDKCSSSAHLVRESAEISEPHFAGKVQRISGAFSIR
jgi:hypothetical protein